MLIQEDYNFYDTEEEEQYEQVMINNYLHDQESKDKGESND